MQGFKMLVGAAVLATASIFLPAQIAYADNVKHILGTGTLEVCVKDNALPYSTSTRDHQPSGFQVDIARQFATQLGVELQESWINLRSEARSTKCDLFVGVAKLEDDEDSSYVKKTKPFFRISSYIVTPAGKPVKTIGDLKDMVVTAPSGSIAFYRLRELGIETVERFFDENDMLNTLISEEANAAVVTNIGLNWFKKNHPEFEFQSIPAAPLLEVTLDYDYAVALRKADTASVEEFNKMISAMQATGTLAKIFSQYGIPYDDAMPD
jgi:ABC-type amino acid transport substrate-binding protein